MNEPWDDAIAVADAILYEGYLLYPARARSERQRATQSVPEADPYGTSAEGNRMRWQFGVLVPPEAVDGTGEEASNRTECLCEPAGGAILSLRLRFLHVRARTVEVAGDAGFRPVPRLVVGDHEHTTWDEAIEEAVDATVPIAALLRGECVVPFQIPATVDTEQLWRDDGPAARVVRRCEGLRGVLRLSATSLGGPFGGVRLAVEVHNTTVIPATAAGRSLTREESLPRAFLGAHTMMALSNGRFVSLVDPPEWARAAAAGCANVRTWPVLVGDPARHDMMLSAPIILYDYPSIAPESSGDLLRGAEIDEILTLRTMPPTDDRAGALLDRVDAMPPDLLDRLHGTIRYLRQATGD